MPNETTNEASEVVQLRIEKFHRMCEQGDYPYAATRFNVNAHTSDINNMFEDYEGKQVSMAGRVMAKRGQGKIAFFDLLDSAGKIQLYLKADSFVGDGYEKALVCDIGDIIGVEGNVLKTQRGQISILVSKLTLLSKAIQVLPEKFHGLKDPDLRYRQRYVDLIVTQGVREVFIARSKIVSSVRRFMDGNGFLEVATPVLSTLAGGATARPFVTHHNALNMPMYMRIAPELPLKRLIVGGFDKVYEIANVFRNEGMDATHNPEFTMMESYQAYAGYEDVMAMVESLISTVAQEALATTEVETSKGMVSLKPPFAKARMDDLVLEHTGVDFDKMQTLEEALEAAKKLHIEVKAGYGIGKIIEEAFNDYVEDKLLEPTFVTHHPTEISPLSKRCHDDPRYTERFELFIAGREFANGFSELNDPFDQRARFKEQADKKSAGDDEAHPYDDDYINALEVGLPPTGGVGIGIDRLVMLLTGEESIRDVILFPTMKPIRND
ncbi:MAG: lysine--tRNA ligase [Eubacteriaceae bacterium]|nr:lysine--tRNA ligase [Eubacteriaceae bacterium]